MQNNCRRVLCQQRVGHRPWRPEAQRLGGTPTQAPEAQRQSGGDIVPKTKGRRPSHTGDAHGSNTLSGNERGTPPQSDQTGETFLLRSLDVVFPMTSAKATDCALPRFSHKWQGPNSGPISRLRIAPFLSAPMQQKHASGHSSGLQGLRGLEAQQRIGTKA